MTSTTPILEVINLTAHYGRAQALFGIELVIKPGEVVALMGRNGAGKSTTLKSICGMTDASATRIRFDGVDILGLPTFRIARLGLGYVAEDRRIFTDLTVAENLEVGRRRAPIGHEPWTLERLVAIFPNLGEMLGRRAALMSGGEQQMLAIARTLMGNPRVILLDEPSEGLAPKIVDQMADAVVELKRQGIAVLLSEQNLRFAAKSSDRVYIIERGQICFTGSMDDLAATRDVREKYLGV